MSLIGAAFGRPLFCLPLAPCRKALPTALSLARIFPVEDQPAVALFHKSASLFSNRLPKVLGPGAHSVIDYSVAALFFTAGALFWSRHKNASISALLCGTGVLLNGLFTDYPGGVVRAISFETHGKIDVGLAGITASIPGLMGFADDPQARFFEATAVAETLASGFTDYRSGAGESRQPQPHEWVA